MLVHTHAPAERQKDNDEHAAPARQRLDGPALRPALHGAASLVRAGRLDRKIELPLPDEKSRMRIMQIHSRKMTVEMAEVNFDELARSTEDFNGAMLKAVCVEAGMFALRREASIIKHEDFVEGIQAVQMKKKMEVQYYV